MDLISTRFIFVSIITFFLLAYWVFNFIILYHLARFGIGTQPKKFAAVFLLGSVTLFFASVLFFVSLDINSLKPRFEKLTSDILYAAYPKQ